MACSGSIALPHSAAVVGRFNYQGVLLDLPGCHFGCHQNPLREGPGTEVTLTL